MYARRTYKGEPMNHVDTIVEEVRRIRDAHAAKFNYDLDAIFRDIKEHEKRSGLTYVSFADEKVEPNVTVPNPEVQPPAAAH
jgi:hypothetical protein